jgi:3-mercaptopyruvate sulfurtransferase SseA
MSRKISVLFTIWILILVTTACNLQSTQPSSDLPQTEAEVPRVMAEEAKAAFDAGEAIIVDVRSADAYETSHIDGAISIPLGQFETNPTSLNLEKDQWIITYCT